MNYLDKLMLDQDKEALTPSEIEHLKKANFAQWMYNKIDPIWVKAFEIYNKHNQSVGMNCPPCYAKVAMWHIKQQ